MLDVRGDLEALVAETHRQVEQRALEREAAAERSAEEALDEARRDATATLEQERRRSRQDAAETRRRLLALGSMQAKREGVERREALLDAVWQAARSELEALAADPERYLPVLRRLARAASAALAAPAVELASDARGQRLLSDDRLLAWGREDGVRYRRAAAPAALGPGLEARAGALRVDASFETRLDQARQHLREATLALLLENAADAAAPDDGGVP